MVCSFFLFEIEIYLILFDFHNYIDTDICRDCYNIAYNNQAHNQFFITNNIHHINNGSNNDFGAAAQFTSHIEYDDNSRQISTNGSYILDLPQQ